MPLLRLPLRCCFFKYIFGPLGSEACCRACYGSLASGLGVTEIRRKIFRLFP